MRGETPFTIGRDPVNISLRALARLVRPAVGRG